MITLTFYIFAFILSYIDFRRFLVPDLLLLTMTIMLLFFKIVENQIYVSSFITPLLVLVIYIIILLLFPKSILGGGDIKYSLVIAFYLTPLGFAYFLVISGILQSVAIFINQKIRKRKILPMVPIMTISVIICELYF